MQNESRADSDNFARADLLEINEKIKDGIEINNDASLDEKFEVKEKFLWERGMAEFVRSMSSM